MNFGSQNEQDETNIELTPLIDVVFLLLIFFMISTTFTKDAMFEGVGSVGRVQSGQRVEASGRGLERVGGAGAGRLRLQDQVQPAAEQGLALPVLTHRPLLHLLLPRHP